VYRGVPESAAAKERAKVGRQAIRSGLGFLGPLCVRVLRGQVMATNRLFGAIFAGLLVVAAGVAVADNLVAAKPTDFFAPGKHQFYVWCAKGGDYTAIESGASAEDAQMKLYNAAKAAGRATCWPVWQGKVSG